jgi:hypothetical protein
MNKLTKDKKDRLVMTAVMCSFATLVVYVFVISPQRAEIKQSEEKLASGLDLRDTSLRWMRMAPTVRSNLFSKRGDLSESENTMAPVGKFNWFYNTLETFRSAHNVRLVDITREPEIGPVGVLPKFGYETATFGVKFNATYHDFGKFLAEFENTFPQMRVQDLKMGVDPQGALGETNEVVVGAPAGKNSELLAITMKVVTLIKPSASL